MNLLYYIASCFKRFDSFYKENIVVFLACIESIQSVFIESFDRNAGWSIGMYTKEVFNKFLPLP